MATEYTTTPAIPYEEFLAKCGVEMETPDPPTMSIPHVRLRLGDNYVWAFRWPDDGAVRFDRFNRNDVRELFHRVEAAFGVKVYSACGLHFLDDY